MEGIEVRIWLSVPISFSSYREIRRGVEETIYIPCLVLMCFEWGIIGQVMMNGDDVFIFL
jgi:hypothetical protein